MTNVSPLFLRRIFPLALVLVLDGGATAAPEMAQGVGKTAHDHAAMHMEPAYVCPMHPQVENPEPGKCPLCGMDLVLKPAEARGAEEQTSSTSETASAIVHDHAAMQAAPVYICPMDPQMVSSEPGKCLICGMDLVLKPAEATGADAPTPSTPVADSEMEPSMVHDHAAMQTAPVYVCPMHPQVVSTEPGKCPLCGMDLVLKPAEADAAEDPTARRQAQRSEGYPATVTVSDAVVNQLGVRTAEVRRGSLTRHVEAVGSFLGGAARSYRPANRASDPGQSDPAAVTSTLVGQVFEREAPLLRQGQAARVRFPNLGAREWPGTVTGLENQISPTTRTLQFRMSVDLQGASVPGGMSALVTLMVDPVSDVLLVPREAVIQTEQGARAIIALEGGRFQPRAVEAEDLGEDEMVIRSGLSEGERVVVSSQFLLDSEANLQAGLARLAGARAGDASAHDASLHQGEMQ